MTNEKGAKGRGVLRDLRAHFQRERKADPCRAEKPEPGGALGWLCTLPQGHDGRHVAHDVDGTVITTWTPRVAIPPDYPIGPGCPSCGWVHGHDEGCGRVIPPGSTGT